jgi:hypothetical protein
MRSCRGYGERQRLARRTRSSSARCLRCAPPGKPDFGAAWRRRPARRPRQQLARDAPPAHERRPAALRLPRRSARAPAHAAGRQSEPCSRRPCLRQRLSPECLRSLEKDHHNPPRLQPRHRRPQRARPRCPPCRRRPRAPADARRHGRTPPYPRSPRSCFECCSAPSAAPSNHSEPLLDRGSG